MNSAWWRYSARDIDTLSWLTSSIAIAVMCSVVVLIHLGARPSRARFSTRRAVTVYGLTVTALLVSTLAYTDAPALWPWADAVAQTMIPVSRAPLIVELWWAPVCAALVIMVSSPFVPGRVFVSGASAIALTTGAASLTATSTIIFAIIGGSSLTRTLIADVVLWRSTEAPSPSSEVDIESVTGVVDRMTAGRFSTQVGRSDSFDSRHSRRPKLVHRPCSGPCGIRSRPLRLADTITINQRAAISALIDGLFSDPQAGVFGARLDLAAAPDDAVAVAVTVTVTVAVAVGMALPEGRRTTVLAPYYLSVKLVVRHIEWRGGESLVVTFDIDSERP